MDKRVQSIRITADGPALNLTADGNLTPAEVCFALELYMEDLRRRVKSGAGSTIAGLNPKNVPSSQARVVA